VTPGTSFEQTWISWS